MGDRDGKEWVVITASLSMGSCQIAHLYTVLLDQKTASLAEGHCACIPLHWLTILAVLLLAFRIRLAAAQRNGLKSTESQGLISHMKYDDL
jgi:hypothetical protein